MLRNLMLCGMLVTALFAAAPTGSALACQDLPPEVEERLACAVDLLVTVHSNQDQYGARCVGVYVGKFAAGNEVVVVCAGKGILDSSHPTDCVAYAYVVGVKQCVGA